jgi:hypothetical protein
LLCLTFGLLVSATPASEPTWLLDSGEARVTLLELYSSEGCSSCPRAERWVGALRDHPELWRRVVPINLHVSYWDRLGWLDRFASAEFTERQYRYVTHNGLGSAYTPGFFVNGREWRGFFKGHGPPFDEAARVGPLRLALGDDEVLAEFVPANSIPDYLELNLAVLGFDLKTNVKAGENRGRSLAQNFVVLALATGRTQRQGAQFHWQVELPLARSEWPADVALAAWVTHPADPTPIQAVGGMLGGRER